MTFNWVALASNWLKENTPVSKEVALVELTKKMPLGIRRGNNAVVCKMRLAREALSLAYSKKFTDLPSVLENPRNTPDGAKTGVTARIRDLAAREEGVSFAELRALKNGRRYALRLKCSGVLVLDGKIYRLAKRESIE
jgi:hypothetical protein